MANGPTTQARCSELVDLLMDYLEGKLPQAAAHALDQHLSGCPNCVAYLATYRQTVSLLHSLDEDDLPQELRIRLTAFLDRQSGS